MATEIRIEIDATTDLGLGDSVLQRIADTLYISLKDNFGLDASVEVETKQRSSAYAGPPVCEECWEVKADCICEEEAE